MPTDPSKAGPRTCTVAAGPDDDGERLDRFLARRLPGFSRARLQALIAAGRVRSAAGPEPVARRKVRPGESFAVDVPAPEPARPRARAIELSIRFEDDQLIVLDKPAGLVVHPAAGHADDTLVNALLAHCGDRLSGIGGVKRPGIVHRLDKDTSGLLVVAKTDLAHRCLSDQFRAHGADGRLERAYLAVVWGEMPARSGRISAPLHRKPSNRLKIAVARAGTGRHAVTHYRVLESYADRDGSVGASLIRCTLETGRTHQIRVHMAHIGHPVVGDASYAAGFAASARRLAAPARAALAELGRQALHAAELVFEHPTSGRRMAFTSEPPPDIQRLVAALRSATRL